MKFLVAQPSAVSLLEAPLAISTSPHLSINKSFRSASLDLSLCQVVITFCSPSSDERIQSKNINAVHPVSSGSRNGHTPPVNKNHTAQNNNQANGIQPNITEDMSSLCENREDIVLTRVSCSKPADEKKVEPVQKARKHTWIKPACLPCRQTRF